MSLPKWVEKIKKSPQMGRSQRRGPGNRTGASATSAGWSADQAARPNPKDRNPSTIRRRRLIFPRDDAKRVDSTASPIPQPTEARRVTRSMPCARTGPSRSRR